MYFTIKMNSVIIIKSILIIIVNITVQKYVNAVSIPVLLLWYCWSHNELTIDVKINK